MPEKVNYPELCKCSKFTEEYGEMRCVNCHSLQPPEKADKIDNILGNFSIASDDLDGICYGWDKYEVEKKKLENLTKQALYKAIVEDSRWPKKSKLREESEEWHISNLVTDAENGMISECESILASILGVKE